MPARTVDEILKAAMTDVREVHYTPKYTPEQVAEIYASSQKTVVACKDTIVKVEEVQVLIAEAKEACTTTLAQIDDFHVKGDMLCKVIVQNMTTVAKRQQGFGSSMNRFQQAAQ